MQIEEVKVTEAQHAEEIQGPQFTKLKLKKPTQKPKEELKTVTLPKVQLKSRIRYNKEWPPAETKPAITFLGSVRQNGQLSRNIKEAAKLKKKPSKVVDIPDLDKVELEKPEEFDFTIEKPQIPERDEPSQEEETRVDQPAFVEQEPIKKQPIPKQVKEKEVKPKQERVVEKPKDIENQQPKTIQRDYSEGYEVESTRSDEIEIPNKDIVETEIKNQIIEQKQPTDEQKDKQPKIEKPKKKKIKESFNVEEPQVSDQRTEQAIPDEQDEKPPNEILATVTTENMVTEKKPKTKKKEKPQTPSVQEELQKEEPKSAQPTEISEFAEKTETHPSTLPKKDIEVPLTEKKPKKSKKPKQKDSPQQSIEEIPEKENEVEVVDKIVEKPKKIKLTPIKIERKEIEISKPQHAESIEGPQFTKLKLKKATSKPKQDTPLVTLPKFQLKSRIKYVKDWPPVELKPAVTFLGSVRQNGILSRNVKEAEKIKKKVYKQPKLPEIEKTELEKPMFGYEDIVVAKNQSEISEKDEPFDVEISDVKEDEPEQFTIKPKRPSIKKTEEIEDEVTIKKKLKAVRKPSVTLPEITEPETVTFRPKSTKTKEDVEQEFNIQLDSYAEEEISMSSKVKLKPLRRPTFSEEANETSIKFYEGNEEEPDVIEIYESDEEKSDETANVMMSLKKNKDLKEESVEEISSSITVSKPKKKEEPEISQDISIKLERKPKYTVDEQEEVSFDVKPQVEQYTQEELSLSSKIKLKPKKKNTISEAADETSIQLKQEIEDDSQAEEVILSEGETDENIEMVIKRKPKKPVYEVSEVEELSVELKPKRVSEDAYEEEQITISTKRKPRKPSKLQGIMFDLAALSDMDRFKGLAV